MDDTDLIPNGNPMPEGLIRFESMDTGDAVTAYASATREGAVSLALSHRMDGDLEVFMDPRIAEELALALARASDEARRHAQGEEV